MEIGFFSCDETVSSCAEVQKSAVAVVVDLRAGADGARTNRSPSAPKIGDHERRAEDRSSAAAREMQMNRRRAAHHLADFGRPSGPHASVSSRWPSSSARVPRPARIRHRGLARDPRAGRARASCRRPCASRARARWSRSASRTCRAPGYAEAAAAARDHGFEAVQRLAGGRAAVFHEQTVAFAWAERDSDPWPGTHDRFREVAGVDRAALQRARRRRPHRRGRRASTARASTASTPAARTKLVGIGQRIIKGGAHIGGVIVVERRRAGCATCWSRSTRRSGWTGTRHHRQRRGRAPGRRVGGRRARADPGRAVRDSMRGELDAADARPRRAARQPEHSRLTGHDHWRPADPRPRRGATRS